MLERTLRTLDALELKARDEHFHMVSLFGRAAPLGDAPLLAQLRLERAHMAKLNRMARLAQRQFQRLERQVRVRVRRRSRALWGLVRNHVLLRSVAWWWLELPSRSTRFEAERCKAIEEFERECVNERCGDIRQEVPLQRRESHFNPPPPTPPPSSPADAPLPLSPAASSSCRTTRTAPVDSRRASPTHSTANRDR
jgi:hypothetical protein